VKTVLVTGGCGFIGSHFVRLLCTRTAWRVVNLDKLTYAGDPERIRDVSEATTRTGRYRFVRGDVADRQLVQAVCQDERPWAVVNFAAESHVDRSILDSEPFLETNIGGVQALLEAARRHPVERFVHISTDEVYGDLAGKDRASEESALRAGSPYAASKAAADLLCLAYRRTYNLPVLIVRSSNNYGPWQFPEKLIPLMIRNALAGETLPVFGDGQQQRDWIYVTDNADAILCVLEKGAPGTLYNVAAGSARTNVDVVRALCRVLAEEGAVAWDEVVSRIRFVPDRPGHDTRYAMDVQRIRRELGWSPRVHFDEGLAGTVRWYLNHRAWLEQMASGDYREYRDAVYARHWGRRSG
jgi:dTDP-glucose 4,6-dehydratase